MDKSGSCENFHKIRVGIFLEENSIFYREKFAKVSHMGGIESFYERCGNSHKDRFVLIADSRLCKENLERRGAK
ncbi:hypothetical protein DPV73_11215 [Leptospira mayottensis]|nr:hypothetical protein DPV73_11215 [Leptospira mayottensis]